MKSMKNLLLFIFNLIKKLFQIKFNHLKMR
jgi:hypothetical protein